MNANLLNLRLRRQAAAAKAIDVNLRAGSGELRELIGHLVGIVRQRVDFVGGERLREPVVATLRRAFSLDIDRLLHARNRETHRGLVVAAPDGQRPARGVEAVRRRGHLIGGRRQPFEHDDAVRVDPGAALDAACVRQRHLRGHEPRAGLVQHRDPQHGARRRRLRETVAGTDSQQHAHGDEPPDARAH